MERRYAQFIAISLAIVLAGQLLQLWLFPKPQRERQAAEVAAAALNPAENGGEGSAKPTAATGEAGADEGPMRGLVRVNAPVSFSQLHLAVHSGSRVLR